MTVDVLVEILGNLQTMGCGNYEVKIPSQTGGEMELDGVWQDNDIDIVHLD